MKKYTFEALNAEGNQVQGILEANSSQEAVKKVKEQGLMPLKIKPTSDGIETNLMQQTASAEQVSSNIKNIPAYGWKIRFRKLLFYIPFLVVIGIDYYLFFTVKIGWLAFLIAVVGLFVFGFAAARAEAIMLGSFSCPQCQTPIPDWETDAKRRVIYECKQCQTKWDIGYKLRQGRYG